MSPDGSTVRHCPVVTALALAHNTRKRHGLAIASIIKQPRPLRSATIAISGTTETFSPHIPPAQRKLLSSSRFPTRAQGKCPKSGPISVGRY